MKFRILRVQTSFKDMNILNQLISSMTKQELRMFKLISNRTVTRRKRKDFLLFDYYKKKEITDEKTIIKRLYNNNLNAFYRLKNRLLNDVLNTLTFQKLNNDNDLFVYKYISVCKNLREKREINLCYQLLKIAEKKALKNESYHLLDLIYYEVIRLSHDISEIDVEYYLKKKKTNNDRLNQLRDIDDILAAINFKIKKTQNYPNTDQKIIGLLEQTINEYSNNSDLLNSEKLKIKLVQSTSKLLLQKRLYKELEVFLKHSFDELLKKSFFKKSNHEIKLQLLTYLINCLFKNKKYRESIKMTKVLFEAIQEYNGFLNHKYLFYYYNGLVINYSRLDKDKALDVLIEAKNNKIILKSDYHYFFICSNLALQYFDKKQYKPSIKILSRIILHKNFLSFDYSFQIKIMIAELIIRYEIGDFDILEMRINKIKNRFESLLKAINYERENLMLKIISKLIYTQSVRLNKNLQDDINKLLSKITNEEAEEIDVINYNKWLEDKKSS